MDSAAQQRSAADIERARPGICESSEKIAIHHINKLENVKVKDVYAQPLRQQKFLG